jgi:HAD superfamily hydrolase (TIGR01549 family)
VDGVVPLLTALKEKVKIGIISNNVVEEQLRKLQICGLTELLDVIVISEEAGAIKPDRKIFEIALERANAQSHEAVMVGDAWEGDILGAKAVGIRPVWYNHYKLPAINASIPALDSFLPTEHALNVILKTQ